jgi:hemerythrin
MPRKASRGPSGTKVPAPVHSFRWGSYYCVGIDELDRQHQQLAELLNALSRAFNVDEGRPVLQSRLSELIAAVAYHFRAEEKVMRKHKFPGRDLHKAEHDIFLGEVRSFQREFDAGQANLSESTLTYLKDWLRDHLLIADKRLGSFLTSVSAKAR